MKPEFADISYEDYCDYLKRGLYEFLMEHGLEAIIVINYRLDDTQTELKLKDRQNILWLEAWFDDIVICFDLGSQRRCEIRPIMSWEWMIDGRWYFKKMDMIELKNVYASHDLKTQIKRYVRYVRDIKLYDIEKVKILSNNIIYTTL